MSCVHLSDRELLDATKRSVVTERRATTALLGLLAEVDARRLYLGEGCSSLFTYCTQVLRLSEHAAYHRIEGARAARQFSVILKLLREGAVTLTTIALLRPHLTTQNHKTLLAAAKHKSKRDVELQIACLAPRPAAKALVRRMPPAAFVVASAPTSVETRAGDADEADTADRANTADTTDAADAGVVGGNLLAGDSDDRTVSATLTSVDRRLPNAAVRPVVTPMSAERYLLRMTVSAHTHAKLRRAQDLLRHAIPNGDPAAILDRALTLLVDQLERKKIAATPRPRTDGPRRPTRSGSRHVPAAIRRVVWSRDQGRCAFVGPHGRCTETGWLEFHHVIPFAAGGPTTVDNLALRCRAHNGHESEQRFGAWQARL